VNQTGYEADNELMCEGRDLPWLQDEPAVDVWASWAVTYRDVWVLDGANEVVGIFNLTSTTLGDPANYAALRVMFTTAAGR
jgi:hypothetical protein